MPEPAERPAAPSARRGSPAKADAAKADRRVYVWWAAALTLLAMLGVFCWAVLVPVLSVSSECRRIRAAGFNEEFLAFPPEAGKESVRKLGGAARAGLALRIYLWVHGESDDNTNVVLFLMGFCGRQTVPALLDQLDSQQPHRFVVTLNALGRLGPQAAEAVPVLVERFGGREGLDRCWIAETLAAIGPAGGEAIPSLSRALGDEDNAIRCLSAFAIGAIGTDSQEVIMQLEALASGDKDEEVRRTAAEALRKIRGQESPK